jgi:hypothetical protein
MLSLLAIHPSNVKPSSHLFLGLPIDNISCLGALSDGILCYASSTGKKELHSNYEISLEIFLLVSWGGVRLSPLGTSATNWPIVSALDDR